MVTISPVRFAAWGPHVIGAENVSLWMKVFLELCERLLFDYMKKD